MITNIDFDTEANSKVEFLKKWDGDRNFKLSGDCCPFSYEFPPIEEIFEAVSNDSLSRTFPGQKGDRLEENDITDQFRNVPIEDALNSQFQLSHYHLSRFYGAGKVLEGFEEQVMVPWREFLRDLGFTYTRCKPYIYFSGPHCATNYHVDISHVVFIQARGVKFFYGLKTPETWAPIDSVVKQKYRESLVRPENLTAEDVICHELGEGEVLWNQLLTPHWVEATDKVSYSILISHGELRLRGVLSQRQLALSKRWESIPEERPIFNLHKYH